jgi:hypothetical protein
MLQNPKLTRSMANADAPRTDGSLDWRVMQTLVRSMPDLHKTLIVANLRRIGLDQYEVDELAIATEHAPFRHKKASVDVGGQRKKAKLKQDDGPDGETAPASSEMVQDAELES